jgi:hypothetical protein
MSHLSQSLVVSLSKKSAINPMLFANFAPLREILKCLIKYWKHQDLLRNNSTILKGDSLNDVLLKTINSEREWT